MADATVGQVSGWRAITPYQWLVFLVVWAGWTLDAADFGLFSLVLKPALTELLGFPTTGALDKGQLAELGKYGGLLAMTGLLGWAAGGFIFGIIADYIGRVRALFYSIIIFSVFTALQGMALHLWDLGIYRFLAGIGTGAELMIGIPLLAETLGDTYRAKISGIMMTGGAIGTFLGAWVFGLVGKYALHLDHLIGGFIPAFKVVEGGPGSWRTVFFAGVVPAVLLIIVRGRMSEPPRFAAVQERREAVGAGQQVAHDDRAFMQFVPLQLFARANRFNTLVGLLFGLGSLLAIWTTNIWLPTILSLMVQKGGISGADAVPFVSTGIMIWSFGGIFGYSAFGFIADWFGRRPTIVFYSIGSIVFGLILYLALPAYEPWYPVVLPIFGFFVFGVFSGHAVYFPELFPTHIRSTGVAFCNGTGRIITSFGPLVAGLLVGAFGGSFNNVTAFMSCFAILSVIAMLMGRETRNDELPH